MGTLRAAHPGIRTWGGPAPNCLTMISIERVRPPRDYAKQAPLASRELLSYIKHLPRMHRRPG